MNEPPLTPEQRHVLRHTLGLDHRVGCEPYRNHYCANEGDPVLAELARRGLMELVSRLKDWLPYDTYRCTDAGRAAAVEEATS
jgi:hypothetical protein